MERGFSRPRNEAQKLRPVNTPHAGNNSHEHEDDGFSPTRRYADTPIRPYVLFLGCVPEDSEEVAGSTGGDEQMPDEMAITELLGQVKSDAAGVSESAGGQPQQSG